MPCHLPRLLHSIIPKTIVLKTTSKNKKIKIRILECKWIVINLKSCLKLSNCLFFSPPLSAPLFCFLNKMSASKLIAKPILLRIAYFTNIEKAMKMKNN